LTPLARPLARRLLAPLLLLALPGCFFFPFRAGTPAQPTILAFEIDGTHAVSASELKEHLVTQASERGVPMFFLRREHAFDEDAFANDKRRIIRYYQARGYYRARVETAEVRPEGTGYVKIRIRVSEGDPVRVQSVEVRGLETAPDARARLGRLPIQRGDIFTEAAYDAAKAAIETALKATGYERADVVQEARVDTARTKAYVTYRVTPGERFRYGGIYVAGAVKIPRARIREEAGDVIHPGQTFDATKLPQAQQRVFDLGVFGGVRVAPGPVDEAHRTMPVVVSVREAPFRTIRAGPSIGIQQSRYDVSAVAGWQHRNWLGGLRKLSLDARAGYAWIPNFFNPGRSGTIGLARADFTQPGVFRHLVDFNIRGELEKGIEPAYDFFAERVRFGFPVRLGRILTFTPSVNLELYHLSNPPTDVTTGQNLTLATCPSHDPSLCLLSYLEQRVALDLRDDPINTRRGLYLAISLQEGFSAFGAGTPYLRVLPEARAFLPLPARTVLALRTRVGIVEPSGGAADVPIVAKFVSGGPNAMRGYYNTQLSPVVRSGTSYVAVGGKGLVDGSAELRFPISGPIGGAAFLDFGNVRISAAEALDLRNLQYAVGAGIRYNTLFGPIRVDVAYRLPTAAGGEQPGVQIADIGPGGTVVPDPAGALHHYPFVLVHLSIGEAF
jgi:translocation and assembly module TamA